jgi:hypothetical protein
VSVGASILQQKIKLTNLQNKVKWLPVMYTIGPVERLCVQMIARDGNYQFFCH